MSSSDDIDIPTSEVVCPVCDRFVYNNPRCSCTGTTLRAEIERLRAEVTRLARALDACEGHLDVVSTGSSNLEVTPDEQQ